MQAMDEVEKELVHTRQIVCRGYRRKDGLWQIEASVADEKAQEMLFRSRPPIVPGELIHHMSLIVVIDDDYCIRDARAATLTAPWAICGQVDAAYAKLIGLRIGPGFSKAVRDALGGVLGCTHLTDLLVQVGNTYMQSSFPDRQARQQRGNADPRLWPDRATLGFVGQCHAWRQDGQVLAREYPQLAGADPADPKA